MEFWVCAIDIAVLRFLIWVLVYGAAGWKVWFVAVAGLSGSGFRSSSGFLIVVPVDIFEFLLRKKRLDEL